MTDSGSSDPPSDPMIPPAPAGRPGAEQQEGFMDFVIERLSKALGPVRAVEVLSDALVVMERNEIETPQDLLELSEYLIRQGGLAQAVGRSFKVKALLRGAVEGG
jgi:hypothetical protein